MSHQESPIMPNGMVEQGIERMLPHGFGGTIEAKHKNMKDNFISQSRPPGAISNDLS